MTVEDVNRLGLGTVQLGMNYGVTNRSGCPSGVEAASILACAAAAAVSVIDTAAAYGRSEQVLGELLGPDHQFRLITKTLPINRPTLGREDVARVRTGFEASLKLLRRETISGLMVHHAADLLVPGGERLWGLLLQLRDAGLIEKLGVSVYDGAEIDAILSRFEIDLIQLPLNVFDQRLVHSGHLLALREWGVEVHARSAFLQGVLLSDPVRLPPHLSPLHHPLEEFSAYCREDGLTPLQATLAFVLQQPVDCVIVGAARRDEYAEVIEAVCSLPDDTYDFTPFACDDERLINPAKWVA